MVVPAMEDADKYSSRKEQFNKKEQERCIGTDMKVEDKVDVKHLKKWMVGTIKHIEENLFGEKILTVQLGNLKIEMNALSRRVGKKGYFSSRQSGRQEQKRSSNQTIILRE